VTSEADRSALVEAIIGFALRAVVGPAPATSPVAPRR
jgi:hypothetical protein